MCCLQLVLQGECSPYSCFLCAVELLYFRKKMIDPINGCEILWAFLAKECFQIYIVVPSLFSVYA